MARIQRTGDRSNAIVDALTEQWGLSRAAVERIAFDHLRRHCDEVDDELRASAAAADWLARLTQTFGERAQLRLRAGQPAQVIEGHVGRALAGTLVRAREFEDAVALDLVIELDSGRDLVIEAVRTGPCADGVLPIRALHLADPVPPTRGVVYRHGPNGPETVVWGADGRRRTYVGGNVRPNRVARFA